MDENFIYKAVEILTAATQLLTPTEGERWTVYLFRVCREGLITQDERESIVCILMMTNNLSDQAKQL